MADGMTPISWKTKDKGPRLEGQIVGAVVKEKTTYLVIYTHDGTVIEVPIKDIKPA